MQIPAKAVIVAACAMTASSAQSHDFWSNGEPVPKWIRSYCCGPEDVHHLPASAVHIMADGYHIDGIKTVIPISKALPSQDGDFWGFWPANSGDEPYIFCFFAPVNGV